MPIIQIHLMEGRSAQQKHAMMRAVTDAVAGSLGVAPTTVRILVQELASGHFAVGGEPRFAEAPAPAVPPEPLSAGSR